MSKYQAFKTAIEKFQASGANAPILYSTIEVNEKGFEALLGRKVKLPHSPIFVVILICVLLFLIILSGATGMPALAGFTPIWLIYILLYRTTLITINDNSLDFYFTDITLSSKYVVIDKFSLPYDSITNIQLKTSKFNTSFTFEFSNNDKKYKIRASAPNKMKKITEQAENMKCIHEMLEKKQIKYKHQ